MWVASGRVADQPRAPTRARDGRRRLGGVPVGERATSRGVSRQSRRSAGGAQRPPPLASGASGVLGDLARRVARLLDAGRNGAIRPARSALTFAGPMATLGVVWLSGLAPLVTFAAASGEPLVGSRSPSIQAAARVRTLAWDVVPEWVPIVSTEDRQQAPSGRSEPPADAASLSLVPLIRPPRLPAPRGWDIIPLAAREVVSQELLGVVLAIVSGVPSTAGVYAAALRRSRAESTDDSPTGRRAVSRFGTSVWVVVQRGWPADSGGFCWRRLRVQTYVHGAVSPVSLDAVNYCYETRGHDATTGVAGSEIAY